MQRTSRLAGDEKEKTLISWYDDKMKLAAGVTGFLLYGDRNWKTEDMLYYLQGFIMLEYDALIVNWGSKVGIIKVNNKIYFTYLYVHAVMFIVKQYDSLF